MPIAFNVATRRRYTADAEYVALTRLRADALATLDEQLARSVEGLVATAPLDALRT